MVESGQKNLTSRAVVVSILAFYSDVPSSNLLGCLHFMYEKTKFNEKEVWVGPSLKKLKISLLSQFLNRWVGVRPSKPSIGLLPDQSNPPKYNIKSIAVLE